jgi:hypothetical protein
MITWGGGETGAKTAQFALVDDTEIEGSEPFTVRLQSPTGGASLEAQRTQASVRILDDDGDRSPCVEGDETLCLNGQGRFRLQMRETPAGHSTAPSQAPRSPDSKPSAKRE